MTEVHEALRRWAKGLYSLEAGVELLIRASGGRFASSGQPWVQQGEHPGRWWIDAEQMNEDNYGALSGGETRLLRITASLLDGPPTDLSRNLAGLDPEHLQLVLDAIALAGGSRERGGWPTRERNELDQGRRVNAGQRWVIERHGRRFRHPLGHRPAWASWLAFTSAS